MLQPSRDLPLAKEMVGAGTFGCEGTEAGATHQQRKPCCAVVPHSWGPGAPAASIQLPQSLWGEQGQLALEQHLGLPFF